MAFFSFPPIGAFGSGTFSGSVGLGGATSSSAIVYVGSANPLTGTTQRGVQVDMTATSAALSESLGVFANITTANSSFTLPYRIQVYASNRAKGAASTITRDVSYYTEVPSQGTNNAAFADNISFSGAWFFNSTSTNKSLLSGNLGVGTDPGVDIRLRVVQPTGTGVSQQAVYSDPTFAATTTTEGIGGFFRVNSAASSFTMARSAAIWISDGTVGSTSTITRKLGIRFDTMTGGTNNAFIADNLTFTGSFFIHSTSTNRSFFTGATAYARSDVASAATITALASTNGFVRLTGSTITSLQGITAGIDGQLLRFFNNAGVAVTIAHENAGATAANRITTMTGADIVTTANGFAEFIYDTGTSRWICMYVST